MFTCACVCVWIPTVQPWLTLWRTHTLYSTVHKMAILINRVLFKNINWGGEGVWGVYVSKRSITLSFSSLLFCPQSSLHNGSIPGCPYLWHRPFSPHPLHTPNLSPVYSFHTSTPLLLIHPSVRPSIHPCPSLLHLVRVYVVQVDVRRGHAAQAQLLGVEGDLV